MHGPPGAGKTSLKRVIIGLSPLPSEEQNATDIVENAVRAVSTDRITADGRRKVLLTEVDNEELIKMLARTVESHRVTSHQTQEPQHKTDSFGIFRRVVNVFTKSRQRPGLTPQITSNSEAVKSIKEQLPKVKPSTELFDVDWIHLLDSGGQPQFQ